MGRGRVITALLLLSVITITRGQYYDILQGLQQLFQHPNTDLTNQYNGLPHSQTTHKQETRKKQNEHRQTEERRTKKPPINQYDYIFSTTQKSVKKNKTISSHNNSRSLTNKNQYSNILLAEYFNPFDVTTKSNRYKTTTTKVNPNNYYNNDDFNRGTTENVFANNFDGNRPVTENVFENINRGESYVQPGRVYENENTRRPANLLNNNGQNNVYESNVAGGNRVYPQNNQNRGNNNNNRGNLNTDFSYEIPSVTANNRNPTVDRPNRVNGNNGYLNTDFNPEDYVKPQVNEYIPKPNNRVQNQFESNVGNNFNNGEVNYNNNNNNNRVNYNNQGNFDPDRITFEYPSDTPLTNQPGVQPAPVDTGLPPITNRPVTDRNVYDNRPSDSSVNYDDQPEILIGPDEDDMSEREKRGYIQLAEKMCDRYKALTVKKVVALPLLPSPDPVTVNVSDCTPVNVPLIIGGSVVSIRDFPHMALVGWLKTRQAGYSWKCGGSLISNQYILTAGHCTYQDKDYDAVSGPPQAVQLGSSYLDDPGALVVKVAAVIRHPKYKQRRSYHDVALIRMANTVTFSEVIRPACLGDPPPEGSRIIATGWGRTEFGGDHSEELRSVSLSVWNMADCREIWGTSLKLPNGVTPDSHMCAGEKNGGKDTCQGDSGGPVQVQDSCLWRVVGVTSVGRACAAPLTPALYARISTAAVAAAAFTQ